MFQPKALRSIARGNFTELHNKYFLESHFSFSFPLSSIKFLAAVSNFSSFIDACPGRVAYPTFEVPSSIRFRSFLHLLSFMVFAFLSSHLKILLPYFYPYDERSLNPQLPSDLSLSSLRLKAV